MELLTTTEIAKKWNISARRVAILCSEGRISKAQKIGNTWLIPANAKKPDDPRRLNKDIDLPQEPIRVIQYLGSKLKVVDDIISAIDKITPEGSKVADLFSGSGVVSYRIAQKYLTVSNDVQEYCSVINKTLLASNGRKTAPPTLMGLKETKSYIDTRNRLENVFERALNYEKSILENKNYELLAQLRTKGIFYDGSEMEENMRQFNADVFGRAIGMFNISEIDKERRNGQYSLFTLYYLNSYFSISQCIEIDSLRSAIDSLDNEYDRNFSLACLMHAVSEVVCSVGKNFAQPMKVLDGNGNIKRFAMNRCLRDSLLSLEKPYTDMYEKLMQRDEVFSSDNQIYCEDIITLLDSFKPGEIATFYLDPPYTIDHYSRFYHVLETLVRYDYPELERKRLNGRERILNGRYRADRYQSGFCIPSRGPLEFEKMISKIRSLDGNIILSYSDSNDSLDTRKRVISIDELNAILKKYYRKIDMERINHRYRKLSERETNRRELDDSEVLFICHI